MYRWSPASTRGRGAALRSIFAGARFERHTDSGRRYFGAKNPRELQLGAKISF